MKQFLAQRRGHAYCGWWCWLTDQRRCRKIKRFIR